MTSLQSRLDESYKHQTNLEQQIVVLEEENLSLKNEKYKVTGDNVCRVLDCVAAISPDQ